MTWVRSKFAEWSVLVKAQWHDGSGSTNMFADHAAQGRCFVQAAEALGLQVCCCGQLDP